MRKIYKLTFIFILSFSLLNIFGSSDKIFGAAGCVNDVPTCPGNQYEPDFACINAKILNPNTDCCRNKCVGDSNSVQDPIIPKYQEFGILGIKVKIDESKIPSLINIALSTFLGIIAIYALFRGIYVAGVKRTQATDEATIENVSKELTAIVIAFIIAFSSIFIVQLVFNVLGLGSLNDLNFTFDGSNPGGPQLVIQGNS